MQPLHRFQDELADFLGHAWLGGGQGFDPRDRIARDNAAVGDSVRRKRMPALGSETEHVARQQHIDDLASAIRPYGIAPRRAGDQTVPATDGALLAINFLIALVSRADAERVEGLQDGARAPDARVRPDRLSKLCGS